METQARIASTKVVLNKPTPMLNSQLAQNSIPRTANQYALSLKPLAALKLMLVLLHQETDLRENTPGRERDSDTSKSLVYYNI